MCHINVTCVILWEISQFVVNINRVGRGKFGGDEFFPMVTGVCRRDPGKGGKREKKNRGNEKLGR